MMQDEDLGGSARRNVVSQGITRISQVNIFIHAAYLIFYIAISISLLFSFSLKYNVKILLYKVKL